MTYRAGTAGRTYPLPIAERCSSCHVDRHASSTPPRSWGQCGDCHSDSAWSPSVFGVAAHERSTFALTGAHVATPCAACHQRPEPGHDRFRLALGAQTCTDCHAKDDPHGERFGPMPCETCHSTEAFDQVVFAHAEPTRACVGCHAPDDPHAGQFEGRDCATCHTTDTYAIPAFDHRETRFPLDGAHTQATCTSCHARESLEGTQLVRYRPLGTDCVDCHGAVDEI
jgi:hypothetical protein